MYNVYTCSKRREEELSPTINLKWTGSKPYVVIEQKTLDKILSSQLVSKVQIEAMSMTQSIAPASDLYTDCTHCMYSSDCHKVWLFRPTSGFI